MINGFLNINKEAGMTSAKVVAKVKAMLREAGERDTKVGHFGTLDPDGEGVLPIGLGRANRLFNAFLDKRKVYTAVFKFGVATDTLDASGEILEEQDVDISEGQIASVLSQHIGKIDQLPPAYSAKMVGGVRAYALARAGKEVKLTPKTVEIFSIRLTARLKKNIYAFRIECGGGTYIRSLARDIAASLGTIGIMTYIRREKSGWFDIADSIMLSELSLDKIIPNSNVLALGFFDALHAGHRKIIEIAKKSALRPRLATFDDDFMAALAREEKLIYLLEERRQILEDLGLDPMVLSPSADFINMEHTDFLRYLDNLKPDKIIAGADYRFGCGAKGDSAALVRHFGDRAEIVELIERDGAKISSGRIRKLLEAGQIAEANDLLGAPYFVSGTVEAGRGAGAQMSIPTANITPPPQKLLPKEGVYATTTEVSGELYPSITNVGTHPTFADYTFNVETHILDERTLNIYNEPIKIYFLQRLRDIVKFEDKDELQRAIAKDIATRKSYGD
jgi:tRNA pseudouridine55 synthase